MPFRGTIPETPRSMGRPEDSIAIRKSRGHGMKSSGAGDVGDVERDVSGGCIRRRDVMLVKDPAGPLTHCPPPRCPLA